MLRQPGHLRVRLPSRLLSPPLCWASLVVLAFLFGYTVYILLLCSRARHCAGAFAPMCLEPAFALGTFGYTSHVEPAVHFTR